MSSEAITRNDLTAILNEVLPPTPSEYKKLLWTNPSPTSAFSAQTISLDLSEYDDVEVEFKVYPSEDVVNVASAGIGEVGVCSTVRTDTWLTQARTFTVSATGVAFSDCRLGSNASVYNNHSVPLKIYGIKYERVAPPQVEDLTIIEDLGVCNIPSTGTWTFPNVKPYKRMFICFPIWGAYNSSTLASTPIFADANQSSTTITNWTNRAGGVVTNTTVSAYVLAIRMEF